MASKMAACCMESLSPMRLARSPMMRCRERVSTCSGDDDLEDLKALVVLDAEGLEALDVDALFREDAGEGGDDVVAVVAQMLTMKGSACGGLAFGRLHVADRNRQMKFLRIVGAVWISSRMFLFSMSSGLFTRYTAVN